MSLIFQEKVKTNQAAFLSKVTQIAARLGVDPNWLMLIMNNESGLNEKSYLATNGAGGLIGFLKSTAANWGVTVPYLLSLSNVQQLDYVERFYNDWKKTLGKYWKTAFDLYLTAFYPAAVGKADSYIIATKGKPAYDLNWPLDFNKDGKITVKDFRDWLQNKYKAQATWFDLTPEQKKK